MTTHNQTHSRTAAHPSHLNVKRDGITHSFRLTFLISIFCRGGFIVRSFCRFSFFSLHKRANRLMCIFTLYWPRCNCQHLDNLYFMNYYHYRRMMYFMGIFLCLPLSPYFFTFFRRTNTKTRAHSFIHVDMFYGFAQARVYVCVCGDRHWCLRGGRYNFSRLQQHV